MYIFLLFHEFCLMSSPGHYFHSEKLINSWYRSQHMLSMIKVPVLCSAAHHSQKPVLSRKFFHMLLCCFLLCIVLSSNMRANTVLHHYCSCAVFQNDFGFLDILFNFNLFCLGQLSRNTMRYVLKPNNC